MVVPSALAFCEVVRNVRPGRGVLAPYRIAGGIGQEAGLVVLAVRPPAALGRIGDAEQAGHCSVAPASPILLGLRDPD